MTDVQNQMFMVSKLVKSLPPGKALYKAVELACAMNDSDFDSLAQTVGITPRHLRFLVEGKRGKYKKAQRKLGEIRDLAMPLECI